MQVSQKLLQAVCKHILIALYSQTLILKRINNTFITSLLRLRILRLYKYLNLLYVIFFSNNAVNFFSGPKATEVSRDFCQKTTVILHVQT